MSNLCQSHIEKLLVFLEHIATLTDNQISTQNKKNDDQNEYKKIAFHQMERIIFHFSFGLHDFFHLYLVAQGPMRIKKFSQIPKVLSIYHKYDIRTAAYSRNINPNWIYRGPNSGNAICVSFLCRKLEKRM